MRKTGIKQDRIQISKGDNNRLQNAGTALLNLENITENKKLKTC